VHFYWLRLYILNSKGRNEVHKVGLSVELRWNGNLTAPGGYGSVNYVSHDCDGKNLLCCGK